MLKRWLLYGAVATTVAVISGGVVHNVSRNWRRHVRTDRAPMQVARQAATPPAAAEQSGQEESESIDLIDLTVLQKQTAEPPMAGFEAPSGLPPVANAPATPLIQTSEPDVAEFRPFSADGPEAAPTPKAEFVNFWKRMAERVWGKRLSDGSEECESLPVLPRPASASECPRQGCPYDGSQYRKSNKPAATGEEEQSIPRTKPENLIPGPGEFHKHPKVDTMDIRPGDIPWAWVTRPF
jgi:hypothetical protein